jgi:hypothetical protein
MSSNSHLLMREDISHAWDVIHPLALIWTLPNDSHPLPHLCSEACSLNLNAPGFFRLQLVEHRILPLPRPRETILIMDNTRKHAHLANMYLCIY